MTYALGRGLQYYDMPVVRDIVREAERQDYRFSAHHHGDRQEHAVSDAGWRRRATASRGQGTSCMFVTKKSIAPADVPARRRHHDGAAVARVDGAGVHGAGADAGQAAAALRRRLRSRTARPMKHWMPDATEPGLRVQDRSSSRSSRSAISVTVVRQPVARRRQDRSPITPSAPPAG